MAFDLERFVEQCRAAARETEPTAAVREVLAEAMRDPVAVAGALPVTRAELVPIHLGHEVTVMKVVWAPDMRFPPHDHLTWACNGLYAGCEHNTVYELDDDGRPRRTGELFIDAGEVGVLGADAIHSVHNPDTRRLSAAIHVYGGDFPNLPRRNWIGEPPEPVPADIETTTRMFAAANAAAAVERRPDVGQP